MRARQIIGRAAFTLGMRSLAFVLAVAPMMAAWLMSTVPTHAAKPCPLHAAPAMIVSDHVDGHIAHHGHSPVEQRQGFDSHCYCGLACHTAYVMAQMPILAPAIGRSVRAIPSGCLADGCWPPPLPRPPQV